VAMESEGYRVIELHGYSPDAIAIKDGRITAVEVLGKQWRTNPRGGTKELHGSWTHAGKKKQYAMFDALKIVSFVRNGEGFSDKGVTDSILSILGERSNGSLRANEIWESLPCQVSQRRVRQILEGLETEGVVKSELQSNGRYGRYKLWKLDHATTSPIPVAST
ncbi:hypothetical protein MUP01_11440, partial [Candidatus Bathyarchaeota archaeon]|nr:hypothetical protein [Candidatus Bathyarchaeota archaeon]